MRYVETRMLNLLITIHENIEVNVAGALINQLLTAQVALNVLEFVEKSQRFEFSLDLYVIRSVKSQLA